MMFARGGCEIRGRQFVARSDSSFQQQIAATISLKAHQREGRHSIFAFRSRLR